METAMTLASGFCGSGDSVSSPPSYTPGTPSSPPSHYVLMRMSTGAPFFLGFSVGSETYGYYEEEYTPSSPLPPAGSSLDYSPSSPLPRAGSPDYTPSEPSAASPYYTPSTPPSRASSPDYTPGTPPWSFLVSDAESRMPADYTPGTPSSSLLVSDAESRMSPDYTPGTPSSSLLVSDAESHMSPDYTPSTPTSRAASPDYTPSTPSSRAASPDYTPSTPPPSPLVSDAESRMSTPRRRHHPYQRSSASTCSSRASRISRGRHQRALGF
ncbi:hypothetical protein ACQ4PT_010041 [Festuca glaucescens]